jgi:hypothetical protein
VGPLITQHLEKPFWRAAVVTTLFLRARSAFLGPIVVATMLLGCVTITVVLSGVITAMALPVAACRRVLWIKSIVLGSQTVALTSGWVTVIPIMTLVVRQWRARRHAASVKSIPVAVRLSPVATERLMPTGRTVAIPAAEVRRWLGVVTDRDTQDE